MTLLQECASQGPALPGGAENFPNPSSSPGLSHGLMAPSTTTSIPKLSPLPMRSEETPSLFGKRESGQVSAACGLCRKRKSRCDGGRPRCKKCVERATCCIYSVEQGKTQQQASREELKAYRTVVGMLRQASLADSEKMLKHLREHENICQAIKFILEDKMLCCGAKLGKA